MDSNDQQRMEELYNRYYKHIYNFFVYKMKCQVEDAEDLAGEVMYKAWQNVDKFRGKSSMTYWLEKIALNKYIDFCRRKKKVTFQSIDSSSGTSDEDSYEMQLPDKGRSPQEETLTGEVKDNVKKALNKLSPKHKEVIELYYYRGMEVEEIAAKLGIAKGTVKSRLFRARNNMEKTLTPYVTS